MATLGNGWRLSTDHAASSYGLAVLVSPDNTAYGEADLLTSAQTAEALGVDLSRVQQLARAGRFPGARKLGRDWLIPVSDVLAWAPGPVGRPSAPRS